MISQVTKEDTNEVPMPTHITNQCKCNPALNIPSIVMASISAKGPGGTAHCITQSTIKDTISSPVIITTTENGEGRLGLMFPPIVTMDKGYCDYGEIAKTGTPYAVYGGQSNYKWASGLFQCTLMSSIDSSWWTNGARLSLK